MNRYQAEGCKTSQQKENRIEYNVRVWLTIVENRVHIGISRVECQLGAENTQSSKADAT